MGGEEFKLTQIHSSSLGHLEGALTWWDAGCSVIPTRADGTKKPQLDWKSYQSERATREQVEKWFKTSPKSGIALVCGAISGNLEMLELESHATTSEHLDRIEDAMARHGVSEAWRALQDSGYMEFTPSGGIHFLYRVPHEVPGNTKIANRPPTAEELAEHPHLRSVTLAETRGEGGFVIVSPTQGTVHKSGDAWTAASGSVEGAVPTIAWSTRNLLHQALADALDEMPEVPIFEPRPMSQVPRPAGDILPGEDFAARTSWDHLLTDYGWQYHSVNVAGGDLWTRPGKRVIDGHSASVGTGGSDNLYVWSSSADLPTEKPISKFAFYAFMEHRGDFSAAGRALYALGYGTRASGGSEGVSDWFDELPVATASTDSPQSVDGTSQPGPRKMKQLQEWTETGVAELAAYHLGDRWRAVSEENGWRRYEQGRWTPDVRSGVQQDMTRLTKVIREQAQENLDAAMVTEDKEDIKAAKALMATANGFRSHRGLNACVARFGQQPGVSVSLKDFDTDRHLVAMANGTMDLRTLEFRDHSPSDMLTKRVDVTYDPNAAAPEFEKFMESVVPDPQYRAFLQRAAGMTFLGEIREAAFFVLHGKTGCGKSQFMQIMHAVMGEYATTAAKGTFSESKFKGSDSYDLHDLMGVRLASMSETSKGEVLNEELIKRITGGDEVKSRALYQAHVAWKPQFTIWVLTNFLPNLDAADDAIWRRVKTVKFPKQFKGAEAEIGIAQRLINSELSGIFNWLLEGVEQYRAHGLKDPDEMSAELQEYRDSLDPVNQWIAEASEDGTIVVESQATISVTAAYTMFHEWSTGNGNRYPMGKKRFGERMEELGFTAHKGSGGVRYRSGLRKNMTTALDGWPKR